jgi:hypothetical protein
VLFRVFGAETALEHTRSTQNVSKHRESSACTEGELRRPDRSCRPQAGHSLRPWRLVASAGAPTARVQDPGLRTVPGPGGARPRSWARNDSGRIGLLLSHYRLRGPYRFR